MPTRTCLVGSDCDVVSSLITGCTCRGQASSKRDQQLRAEQKHWISIRALSFIHTMIPRLAIEIHRQHNINLKQSSNREGLGFENREGEEKGTQEIPKSFVNVNRLEKHHERELRRPRA